MLINEVERCWYVDTNSGHSQAVSPSILAKILNPKVK